MRKIKLWSKSEEEFLKENYLKKGCDFCAQTLSRTNRQVSCKASKLKLSTPTSFIARRLERNKNKYIGKVFGRLTVVDVFVRKNKTKFMVVCECGKEKEASAYIVLSGNSKSCGCLISDSTVSRFTKHGKHRSKEYNTWMGMKQRCYDKKFRSYPWHGKIGVTVCERWLESFENFIEDMGEKPTPSHSIDRINPFGNYEPGNCRWANKYEQAVNKRKNNEKMQG